MNMNVLANPSFPEDFSNEPTIDLLSYWRTLLRYKISIIFLGLVTGFITTLIMLDTNSTYRSSVSLLIEPSSANITSIKDIYGLDGKSREYIATQFELLKNRNLAERVILDLNLMQHPEFVADENEPAKFSIDLLALLPSFLSSKIGKPASSAQHTANEEQILLASVIKQFADRLTIIPVDDTDLVKVAFVAEDPKLAANIANALANAYIETDMEQRVSASQNASIWLSGRLQGLRETLSESEQKLQEFLDKEQLVDIKGVTSLNIQELDELTSQASENRSNRAAAETLYRQVESLSNPTLEQLLTFPAILNHSSIQDARQNVISIDQQTAELSSRYGRNHPRMIALATEQNLVQRNLSTQVQQVLSSLKNDYLSALNNEEATLARIEQSKSTLQGVNRKSYDLQELQREVETNRQLYDMFFTRIRETDETSDFKTTNAIVVDPAVPAVEASGPHRKKIIMIAIVLGMALGVFLAFLREFLDNTIKNHTDIKERLQAATLGVVPLIDLNRSEQANGHAYLGFLENKQSSFSEALRTIRTSITLSSIDRPYKVIEITSSVPNEGKSTLAINLASVIGQMGSVLLIDVDMRRPSLNKSLGLDDNAPGLSNFMAGSNEVNDCIYQFEQGDISIMPAGHLAPNPLELIASEKFKLLLKELGQQYDHIILDTPPTQAVSDALLLGSIADAVVYIVKADSTSASLVKAELTRLRHANANVIGVVLNQVDVSKQASYNYGGYYDSEGYGSRELA